MKIDITATEPNYTNNSNLNIKKKVQFEIENKDINNDSPTLDIFIGTWNMAGITMNTNENFFNWLFPVKEMKTPDLYVIGFQEIVKLNASNIFINSNEKTVDTYKIMLTKNLNKIGEYVLFSI